MSQRSSQPEYAVAQTRPGDDASYWDEVDAAWEERERPAPRRLGPVRGSVLAAMMLGVAEVLEPPRQEVVSEVPIDRPDEWTGRVRLLFDPGSPSRTVAFVAAGTR